MHRNWLQRILRSPRGVLAVSLAGLGLGTLLLSGPASAASPDKTDPDPKPDPLPTSERRERVERYLAELERVTGIEGIATFGLAASLRESGWYTTASNPKPFRSNPDHPEAQAACRGWKGALKRGWFKENPWRDDAEAWCWGSGGWFGFLPSTMLGRSAFQNLDPATAPFDPALATAAFGAFCAGIIRNTFPDLPADQRNWYTIRMAMASLQVALHQGDTSKATATKVINRLNENLGQIGQSASFAARKPTMSKYPGNAAVLAAMIEFQKQQEGG